MSLTSSPIMSRMTGVQLRRYMDNRLKEYQSLGEKPTGDQVEDSVEPVVVSGTEFDNSATGHPSITTVLNLKHIGHPAVNGQPYSVSPVEYAHTEHEIELNGLVRPSKVTEIAVSVMPKDASGSRSVTKLRRQLDFIEPDFENPIRENLRLISYFGTHDFFDDGSREEGISSLATMLNIDPDLTLGENLVLVNDSGFFLDVFLITDRPVDRDLWGEVDSDRYQELFMQTELGLTALEDYMFKTDNLY